jgi:hypothetical protein
MSRILSGMAEMNANFSGIGNLSNVIRGMNDRQSAMESRITHQYGLQNDFNSDQTHFNNQARNFFSSGQNQYAPPPPSYYFSTSNSPDTTSSTRGERTNTYAPNMPNPFQFEHRQPVLELDQLSEISEAKASLLPEVSEAKASPLQLGNEFENADLLFPGMRQPDYSIPRYISLPSTTPNYNEPLQLTNGPEKEEDQPILNSDAENIVEQFMPQANVLDAPANDIVAQISNMEQYNNDRQARSQQKKTKDDGKGEDAGNVLGTSGEAQPSLARDGHNLRDADLEKHAEIDKNAMNGYDDVNNILQDYEWFMNSMEEQKYKKSGKYGQPELQRTMEGEELRIYNKLMKVGTKANYKGDAYATHRTTAYKNIKAREADINEFVKRNQPKQAQPDYKQRDYVPQVERSDSLIAMLERDKSGASGVATPSANELLFH